jgi:tetratricopeptide (TPR) repeat protein
MEKVIEICSELGDNRQAGEALSYLAANATIEGDLPAAQGYNARLLENAMRRHNPVQIVWNLQWAGSIEIRRGEYERALEISDRARKILDKTSVGEVAELIIPGIRMEALWRIGERDAALSGAKQLLDRAAKMQVVDYSVVVGFFHFMDVIFLALEQAYEQDQSQAEKDELMKYARLALKVMKSYARVFTVGAPSAYRFSGWIDWYSGKKEKALRAWRMAAEKAHPIPMHYEEGVAYLTLASHLPSGNPERTTTLEKARQAFQRGGLEYWVGITGTS